ncbi:DUF1217 domain-containing protein [Afifella pfennigii]|uniref:DUF1217 domain-containing protein n=1 Tax=Afifella pfennigii TaxID=209897 RepID=UPI00047C5BDF|nr:DUF1217 domain-containing protein [Afifella pfennigii]
MISTYISYQRIAANLDRSLSMTAAERPVQLETEYYRSNIGEVRSIDDFLADTRLFRYAMTAFGLEDMAHAKGMIRKVLEEGVEDKKSFANRLNDPRFKEFAQVFNFARDGEATTQTNAARQGVVDRYVRQTMEVTAGEENEGVRLALYFQRSAPEVTSAYSLLADPALWQVVKTIYGFPDEMANADIDKQAAAIEKRLDVADLQDPEKLSKLLQRFTAMWDVTQETTYSPILALFEPARSPSVGLDLVMTLQNLKYGGR